LGTALEKAAKSPLFPLNPRLLSQKLKFWESLHILLRRFYMNILRKTPLILAAAAIGFLASCASTGNFMPLSPNETVIGTVQAVFVARNTLNGRDALNTQAYIKLLETAQRRYSPDDQGGVSVDIRDIIWVSGREVDTMNREYAVTGKVIQVN
jgi:hypothetical protein